MIQVIDPAMTRPYISDKSPLLNKHGLAISSHRLHISPPSTRSFQQANQLSNLYSIKTMICRMEQSGSSLTYPRRAVQITP